MPPAIHVAGTNGKGSLIAFLRAIAEALGKRVQVYTSTHLVGFHERIVLPGPMGSEPISEDLLTDCLSGDARQFHFVWGMMETKDAHAFIRPFKGLIERVYTVTIPGEANALSAEALAEIATTQSFEAMPATGIPDALLMSQANSCRPVRVLICGSLYLAGTS